MTTEATSTSFIVSISSIACVLTLCLPHLTYTVNRWLSSNRKTQDVDTIYEDKDGRASEASQAAFSDFTQRLLLILASVCGLALAAVFAVVTLTHRGTSNDTHLVVQQWLQFGSWVRLTNFLNPHYHVLTLV